MRTLPHPTGRTAGARRGRALLTTVLAVAAAGCGGGASDQAGAPADGEEAAGPVTFVAADIAFEEAPDSLSPGTHTVELVNEGDLPHTVTIEELDDRDVVEADGGQTATGEVELDAGSYTYYCSVPGHRDAGMEGILEVSADAG